MYKPTRDYKLGKVAKKFTPIAEIDKKTPVWCGDGTINKYWDKLTFARSPK
jgi:hypothetical protein